ncbi:phosphoribosyltransferase [Pannonibacter indicus]|uniref:phosphoribosyltransferase n=1 Tax=Pannonibacter indicus TaxID=466044 RepID=UPI0035ADBD99
MTEPHPPALEPHAFWQELHAPGSFPVNIGHRTFFPATLASGEQLRLPIRPLADGKHALASLIVNQAGFTVLDALAQGLAERLTPFAPDVVVGLPTLGLTLAAETARRLGHSRYVPLGTSRKFWYDDSLSVPLSSITTPDQIKRLYVDPRMLPLLQGRRIALVDDVISSGTSIRAALALLAGLGLTPVVIGAAMLQSRRWSEGAEGPDHWTTRTVGCFETPMLEKGPDGLWHVPEG